MLNRQQTLLAANPRSVLRASDGRLVELKVHRATWSGSHPENSLAGLRECYGERVGRVEIDFRLLGGDFVVAHDEVKRGAAAVPLRDALEIVRCAPVGPTLLMLDAKDNEPWSAAQVELLTRTIEPVRDRIFVGSPADWNLRRLRTVDPALTVAFDPQYYLTWSDHDEIVPGRRGAYGYQDAHPLALRRTVPAAEYLRERFDTLVRLVPGARELHLRLTFFEHMQDDGFDVVGLLHDAGVLVDVWTLDAGTPAWQQRLAGAVAAGVDIVTTNTPRELAAALADVRPVG